MTPFRSSRLPVFLALPMLVVLLGACGKREAGIGNQASDLPGSVPSASARDAGHVLPEECLEAEAAQRACTEMLAVKYERIGQFDAARTLRDGLPAEMDEVRARWRSITSKDGLKQSCAAARDGIRTQPQCQP